MLTATDTVFISPNNPVQILELPDLLFTSLANPPSHVFFFNISFNNHIYSEAACQQPGSIKSM